jgi:hypothetical protein
MKKWDGFDECVIGVANIWRDQMTVEVLVYSADSMINQLMVNDGMSDEEAEEYFCFNIEGAYIGIDTPVLVYSDPDWKEREYELYD